MGGIAAGPFLREKRKAKGKQRPAKSQKPLLYLPWSSGGDHFLEEGHQQEETCGSSSRESVYRVPQTPGDRGWRVQGAVTQDPRRSERDRPGSGDHQASPRQSWCPSQAAGSPRAWRGRLEGIVEIIGNPDDLIKPGFPPDVAAAAKAVQNDAAFYFFGRDSGGTKPDRR